MMKQPILETSRLLIRELLSEDEQGMYALDSNPKVHVHLGNNPVTSMEITRELIAGVRQQYMDYGVGRWAMLEKKTNEFIGWSGFKRNLEPVNGVSHFLDIGYRLREKFWGRGYAFEAAKACMDYAFANWDEKTIYGMAMQTNTASIKILNQKLGMQQTGTFLGHGAICNFYEITKIAWLANQR